MDRKFGYYEFGGFRLDAKRRQLSREGGETVLLTKRNFDLLLCLLENQGRIMEHDELLDIVWDGTFVEQSNLKKGISALRHILEESSAASGFIETIPRRGYRFNAPVRFFEENGDLPTSVLVRETKTEILVEEIKEEKTRTFKPAVFWKKIKHQKIIFLLISLFVIGTIGFGAWQYFKPSAQRFAAENLQIKRVVSESNLRHGVLSGDGNFFVYSLVENGDSSLWVKQVATGGTTQIFQMKNSSFWFFTPTPDGKYVYFTVSNRDDSSKNGLYRIPAFGGVSELITEKELSYLHFSPDGKRLAGTHLFADENTKGLDRHEILVMNADGSGEMMVSALPPYHLVRGLGWTPDG